MVKYIMVTGGVISGIGKGIIASSIGFLLENRGFKVTAIKIDPYLNVDAGTISPSEHGECFVLDDGCEVDLDLGNYERFLSIELTNKNSLTSGKIYQQVFDNERNGIYLGKTIQIQPHITDQIQKNIIEGSEDVDFCIVEIGGTVDDMENIPILEAIRQLSIKCETFFINVSLIITNGVEQKTRPTQQSIISLRTKGILPNMLILRTEKMVNEDTKRKLSMFCGIRDDCILSNIIVNNIYLVPELLEQQNICSKILSHWSISDKIPNLEKYYGICNYYKNKSLHSKKILIAAKYFGQDQYLSIIRALEHAAFVLNINIDILWLNTETMDNIELLDECDGIIIPGGFGTRGIDGKIKVANYGRTSGKPTLGICLGFQVMIVEFCNNVIGMSSKSSEWLDIPGEHNVIDIINDNKRYGGTMKLGNHKTSLKPNSQVSEIYQSLEINERHRHRYEFNNLYKSIIEENNLIFVGESPEKRQDVFEYPNHKFFIGCQYHPEFKSKYNKPHPLFVSFLNSLLY